MTDLNDIRANIEAARSGYLPDKVRCLLIAEAPPDGLDRFFYYPEVKTADGLFLGVMEVLYPGPKHEYLAERRPAALKDRMLSQFQSDGYFLMDLLDVPKGSYVGRLEDAANDLVERVERVITRDTPIVLIKANVYDIAKGPLRRAGFHVADERIPFPGSGHRTKFREAFSRAIAALPTPLVK